MLNHFLLTIDGCSAADRIASLLTKSFNFESLNKKIFDRKCFSQMRSYNWIKN